MSKQTFHRRTYQPDLTELKMPAHYYGFTNRILMQQLNNQKEVSLFVPVYIIMKIKNFQGIDVHNLMGNVNSVIIINILIQNLPEPLIHLFTHAIQLQINRSQLLFLKESREENISMSRSKRMLKFTIRKTLAATIDEDTFWSPFEIIRLVVSITFNSISKRDGTDILSEYLEHKKNEKISLGIAEQLCSMVGMTSTISSKKGIDKPVDFNQFRKYNISFNCMRNGLQIPISYALGCVYSLYDLAETGLEVYHTNLDSYTEVIQKYKSRNDKGDKKSQKDCFKMQPQQVEDWNGSLEINEDENKDQLNKLSRDIFAFIHGENKAKKDKKMPKPKYSQYTHFVIPLYKYPGNSLMTIFIPLFLLSLLSLAIFFQPNDLSARLGSIATMVLGYIALIPSIKEQLPPSSRITVIEIVIYISTLCCLFSLVESLLIDESSYHFHWSQNFLFLMCLTIHGCIFVFVLALMAKHKLVWEPGYNKTVAARLTDPESNPEEWINFYCDQEFYKANHKIYQINSKESQKKKYKDQATMISKYQPIYEIDQQKPPKEKSEGSGFKKSKVVSEKPDEKIGERFPLIYSRTESLDVPSQSEIKGTEDTKSDKGVDAFVSILKGAEKKEQKKEPKAPRKLFAYEKRLNWLDDLIAAGKHVQLKEAPKPSKLEKDDSPLAKPATGHHKEKKT